MYKQIKQELIALKKVFAPSNTKEKYIYLGYIVCEDNPIIQDFLWRLDNIVRPWYVSKTLLRMLHLYGNNNSYWRVKNYRISLIRDYLLNGIMIVDMKWKFDSFRLYVNNSTDQINLLIKETCIKMEEEDKLKRNG